MSRIGVAAAGGLIALTVATSYGAWAHGGASGIVKERMDNMMSLGSSVKVLTEMFQGKTSYDADAVREQANRIKAHSGDALIAKFPEGSNASPSEARSEIWSDWETFADLAQQLEVFADGLGRAAANPNKPRGGMMSGGGMMGGGSSMMGGGAAMMPGGQTPSAEQIGQMPPDRVFGMVVQTCSACHTKFRIEKN